MGASFGGVSTNRKFERQIMVRQFFLSFLMIFQIDLFVFKLF